jgi:twitching motility protein PilT
MPNIEDATLHELLKIAYAEKASDLFIKSGSVPKMRQHALVKPLPGEWGEIDDDNAKRLILSTMTSKQAGQFEDRLEMDLAFSVGDMMRIRANLYFQRGCHAGVFRLIPLEILSVEQLGLPPVLNETGRYRQGLVLFTGPTGSGKTTSLAAIIDLINRERQCHIVTIEDPLEFVHPDKGSYISQREVHIDTHDFHIAMRAVVREAPDIILVGEMRDPETMNVALQAGETGHLVFSTVHTPSAGETLDRIINMFPPIEPESPGGHSELVGYALDGFGIFGRYSEDGQALTNADLDECHGHTHEIEWDGATVNLYHYHAPWEYPYTLGCYQGTPIDSGWVMGEGGQQPPQGGNGGNPPPPGGG